MPDPFTAPNTVPAFTGEMWLNKDGTVGAVITDVFNVPIHLIGTKEGSTYRVRGWRGDMPEVMKLAYDGARPDGLPDDAPVEACPACAGHLYWRPSLLNGPDGGRGPWHCAKCVPADSRLWLDGVAVGKKDPR